MASAVVRMSCDVRRSADPGKSGRRTRFLLGDPGVLSVCGEVDLSTVEELRRLLRVLAMDSSPTVAVDLAGVTFLSCAGLTPLVEARRQLGRRLQLRAVSPAAERLLRLTELTAYFGLGAPPTAAGR